jgi:hypothetical protein
MGTDRLVRKLKIKCASLTCTSIGFCRIQYSTEDYKDYMDYIRTYITNTKMECGTIFYSWRQTAYYTCCFQCKNTLKIKGP